MIKIVSDTLSCITPSEAQQLNIALLPQFVIFNETETYRDDFEITYEQFLAKLKQSSALPKTSAPSPSLYNPVYSEALQTNDTILVIVPSETLSGTYRGASVGAQDFPEADIRVFDTACIGPAQGSMTRCALEWVSQGLPIDLIIENLTIMRDRQKSYFVVDTLEYLHKNGRIGTAKALLGSVLEIKPILRLNNGSIVPIESQRTQKKAIARLRELVYENYPKHSSGYLTICHANAPELAKQLAEEFAKELNLQQVPIFNLPPAIMVHTGPGTICAQFFTE